MLLDAWHNAQRSAKIVPHTASLLPLAYRTQQHEHRWMIFEPAVWAEAPSFAWLTETSAQGELNAGRGQTRILATALGEAVHRHYRRGGHVARLLGDRYWFRGFEATRAAREFRLLAQLRAAGLDVPVPWLAQVERDGLFYRADLVTARITDARSLADQLANEPDGIPWTNLASAIARLHAQNIWHADLNAHNAMIDRDQRVWLIDFDRAEQRLPKLLWREDNLARLQRSLRKLGAERLLRRFDELWDQFLDQYAQAFAEQKRNQVGLA